MELRFKENCPDLRNIQVVDVIEDLKEFHSTIDVYDPWASNSEAQAEYGITLINQPDVNTYETIIIAVSHDCFKEISIEAIRPFAKLEHIIFDVKYLFSDQDDVHYP